MKINYRRQHNNKRNLSRALFILLLLSAVTAILYSAGLLSKITQSIYTKSSSISTSIESITDNIINIFTPKSEVVKENQKLRTQLQELQITALYNKSLLSENSDLHKLLNNQISDQDGQKSGVLARIISYRDIPYGTILAKTESENSVAVGDWVNFGNWTIGKVAKVNESIILITLLTNSGDAYDVVVGDWTGTLLGRSNGIGKIILPRTEAVEIGMSVSLPSANGLIIGFVESIDRSDENSMQTVLVRTPLNLDTLRFVTIYND